MQVLQVNATDLAFLEKRIEKLNNDDLFLIKKLTETGRMETLFSTTYERHWD